MLPSIQPLSLHNPLPGTDRRAADVMYTGSDLSSGSSVGPSCRYSRKRSHAVVELHDGKRAAMTKTNPRGCVFCMVEDRRKCADAPLCIIRRYVQCHALRRTLFSNKAFYIFSSPWLHNGIQISYSLDHPPSNAHIFPFLSKSPPAKFNPTLAIAAMFL